MAKKPTVVYGGPYAGETDPITFESSKEKPDYDGLISEWKTISQGAVDYIASLKKPEPVKDGVFVQNASLPEETQTEIDLENL